MYWAYGLVSIEVPLICQKVSKCETFGGHGHLYQDPCRKRQHKIPEQVTVRWVYEMVQKVLTDLLIAPASFTKLPYKVIVGMNV